MQPGIRVFLQDACHLKRITEYNQCFERTDESWFLFRPSERFSLKQWLFTCCTGNVTYDLGLTNQK